MYSQGRGRHFKVGQHAEAVEYLSSVCPLTSATEVGQGHVKVGHHVEAGEYLSSVCPLTSVSEVGQGHVKVGHHVEAGEYLSSVCPLTSATEVGQGQTTYCWQHGLVVHVQFWSSLNLMLPHNGT